MIEVGRQNVKQVITGEDNIVIRNVSATIEGGRALDMTEYKAVVGSAVIKAGFVIIRKEGQYKPMIVTKADDVLTYGALPDGYEYAGILIASINGEQEGAGILVGGEVNKSDNVMPVSITSILNAVKTALPNIIFMEDGE